MVVGQSTYGHSISSVDQPYIPPPAALFSACRYQEPTTSTHMHGLMYLPGDIWSYIKGGFFPKYNSRNRASGNILSFTISRKLRDKKKAQKT